MSTDLTKTDDDEQDALVRAYGKLDNRERGALKYFQDNASISPLSPELAEELFGLFRMGKTCEEIRKIRNLTLGQVVGARVFGYWDDRLETDLAIAAEKLPSQVLRTQTDAVDTITKLIATQTMVLNEAMNELHTTGDGTKLRLADTKEYRNLLESLLKLTGQSNKKIVEHRGSVGVNHSNVPATPQEAENILDALLLPVKDEE